MSDSAIHVSTANTRAPTPPQAPASITPLNLNEPSVRTVLFPIGIAAALVLLIASDDRQLQAWAWFAFLSSLQLFRYTQYHLDRSRARRGALLDLLRARQDRIVRVLIPLTGIGWGLSALCFFPHDDPTRQALMTALIGSIAITNLNITLYSARLSYLYKLSCVTPLFVLLALENSTSAWTYAGLLAAMLLHDHLNMQTVQQAVANILRLSEANIAQSERLATIIATAPGILAEVDLRDIGMGSGTISYISAQSEAITGFPASELAGKNQPWIAARCNPQDLAVTREARIQAIAEHKPWSTEYRFQHAGGHWIWINERGRPRYDESGKMLGYTAWLIDVSDRIKAEHALRQLNGELETKIEERSRELVNTMLRSQDLQDTLTAIGRLSNLMWWVLRPKTGQMSMSENLTDKIDPTGETALERWRYFLDRIEAPGERDAVINAIINASQTPGAQVASSFTYRDPETDSPRTLQALFLYTTDKDGEIDSARGIMLDVTELTQTREQLHQAQKLESMGQIAGGMAHDFNNMLTIVLGNLQLAESELQSGTIGDAPLLLEEASQAAARGGRLVQQLLAYARRQPLHTDKIEPDAFVRQIAPLVQLAITQRNRLELYLEAPSARVRIDSAQLEAALLNLAINARDAMPDGGTLRISTRERQVGTLDEGRPDDLAAGDYWVIAIEDTGTGIPAKLRERIFEPFFTTKGVGKGTGLGLSMVHGFAAQSGGSITVASESGKGTRFELFFPLAEQEQGEAGEVPDQVDIDSLMPSCRVLLVDDEPGVRRMVTRQLNQLDCTVTAVADAAEALAALRSDAAIDVLISDIFMPGAILGTELARKARRERPELGILLVSGNTQGSEAIPLPAGAQLLSKPFSIEQLQAALLAIQTSH